MMSHVLEHFNGIYLKLILQNISSYLTRGGVFVCEVPNDDANYELLEAFNQAPHLSFFSEQSLLKIMEENGFSVKYIRCVGTVKDISSKFILSVPAPSSGFKSKVKAILFKSDLFKKIFRYLQYFLLHHLKALKNYYFINHTVELIRSSDFSYGDDRSCIRICVMKK